MNAATEFERQATIEKQERDELAAELAKCAKLRRDVDNEQRQDETLRVNKLQMELQMLQQLQDDDDTTASRPEEVGEACGQGSPAESLRHRRRQPDIFVEATHRAARHGREHQHGRARNLPAPHLSAIAPRIGRWNLHRAPAA